MRILPCLWELTVGREGTPPQEGSHPTENTLVTTCPPQGRPALSWVTAPRAGLQSLCPPDDRLGSWYAVARGNRNTLC